MVKSSSVRLSISFFLIGLVVGSIVISRSCGEVNDNSASADRNDTNDVVSTPPREKPIVIWYHSGEQKSTLPIRTALSSGLITHVFIKYRSRSDGPWYAERRVREAIEVVKKSDAKLIWGRTLWAWYKIENSRLGDLFDPDHYIREIRNVKAEAKAIGADFTALDTEAYGNSPMRPFLLSGKRVILNQEQHHRLQLVINEVIQKVGQVDFIAPAGYWGYPGHNHPYDVLATLGILRIAENTYYDSPRQRNAIKYPYEIFGVYVNTTKKHDESPHNPYFLVSEIFERSKLWSNKKGLFLYTSVRYSQAVAEALVAYSKTIPFRDSVKSREPNQP
jgi:hypothetical protein